MEMQRQELVLGCQAVAVAVKLCEAVRSENLALQTMTKLDQSPVTIADYGSQAIICKMLKENFPDDPVVAEEDAKGLRMTDNKDQLEMVRTHVQRVLKSSPSVDENDILGWIDHGNGSTSKKRFWTLDPIDGTKGFLRGHQYAVCLSLIQEGEPQIGIVACPALDLDGSIGHLFFAEKGNRAWRKPLSEIDNSTPERIQVKAETNYLVQSFESSHGNHPAQEAVAKAVGIEEMVLMDSQAKYSMIACGRAGLYLRLSHYKENIWDHAAGVVLVEEAGGRVTDRNGKALGFTSAKMTGNSGVVVSNGDIMHNQVLSILRNRRGLRSLICGVTLEMNP